MLISVASCDCVLLDRVDEVYRSTMFEELKIRFPTPESWERSKHRPSLETLAYVLQNGAGPIDPPPPGEYAPFGNDDDGSFRSDDCSDTDDDDDSSIGDDSITAPPAPPSFAHRLATLESLRANISGALTEAESALAKAPELGLSGL